jgi:small-conductance mechanosensitive channel
MGAVLFIYVHARVRMLYTTVEFIQMFVQALVVWLFSRWFLDLFSLVAEQKERFRINMQMLKRLRRLIRMIRWFAILYIIVGWLFNEPVPILGTFRLLFEIALILWVFGILFSLHAVGLNPTSLAVAFGALGIGLGFGLQNIFNNFISGIILLFERPIQVGDAIEINGIWGTVKKINVRATCDSGPISTICWWRKPVSDFL